MEPDVTLADIMEQLKLTAKVTDLDDVAKKKDLIELQSIVTTNTVEIHQLKDDLSSQAKRIQHLEDTLGQHAAAMLNRTPPDVDIIRQNKYGGAQSGLPSQNSRKKNLVFEGVPDMSERETIGFVVQLCSSLQIVAYQGDIEAAIRMRRRDNSTKPAPVLVTFAQLHIRSALLRNKSTLLKDRPQ